MTTPCGEHFRGGVLWAGLGPQADVEGALDRWAVELGIELGAGRDATEKARLLAAAVRREAQGAPVLVVLDDVWAWEDAKPFVEEIAFPGCVQLCTTRDARIARRFAGAGDVGGGAVGARRPRSSWRRGARRR